LYKVSIIKPAQKDFRNLPEKEKPIILEEIKKLQNNPRPHNSKKLIGSSNAYRIRKGDYRVLYTINDGAKEVIIYKIDHRKDVYR